MTAGDPPHVRDAAGHRLDLVDDVPLWLLLALTGGHPAKTSAIWRPGGSGP